MLLTVFQGLVQSPNEFLKRYAISGENSYIVRPGIQMRVNYGSGGEVSELTLVPHYKSGPANRPSRLNVMDPSTVAEIIDETVPSDFRGKQLDTSEIDAVTAKIRKVEYERVTITHTSLNTSACTGERLVVIKMKQPARNK